MGMTETKPELETGAPDHELTGILPLLSGEGDQRLLVEWIQGHEKYRLVDPDKSVATAEFDLCVLDGKNLKAHAETLRKRKRESEPVLLPCLLLLPEADISVLDADRGEIADNVVFETVDEIVSMPIKKAELEWRTEALLRLRSQSLRLSEKQQELRLFKRATEAAGHAVYITDADGVIEYVNPAFEEMTGHDAEAVIGETPAIFDSGEMPDEYFERLWKTITAGDTWREELVNRRKDGSLYHAHQTIAPVTDDSGNPEKYVAIQSDITDHIEAAQKLETFRDIVERIDDPIMFQDRKGDFQLVNEAVTEYADMSREELLGADEFAFMDEESAQRVQARKQQVLETEQVVRYGISPTFPTRSGVRFSTVRYPHYGEDGTLDGTVAICRNVTELKLRDEQLQIIDRVLRHNLRNDMTSVGMFAEKIENIATGETADYARRIRAKSEQVTRLVEKQREITRFLTDPPDQQTLDLVTMVETTAERLRNKYPAATIQTDTPGTCDIVGTTATEKAMLEVAENAIVHSDKDTPTVEISVIDEAEHSSVRIIDDGPGIPEMEQKVLTRGTAINPLYHGSGLGLWLVNLIVTDLAGTISIEENTPRGSVVVLRFPK